jgi:ubiquinone/menaquinone biosynthesis C-methylase UbiE
VNAKTKVWDEAICPLRECRPVDVLTWGMWEEPEASVNALGVIAGQDVLDLGCGMGETVIALALQGASCTGYDFSRKRIKAARLLAKQQGAERACRFEVRDAAAPLPLADASVDVVISQRGGLSYSDPREVLPEVARVLRPGGLLAACVVSPLMVAAFLLDGRSYFDVGCVDGGIAPEYALRFGEWVRLLRANRFGVEDVIELPCPLLPYPVEQIWKARAPL